eukprot:4544715-Pleurochrysis_carterae.AAC.1
MPVRDCKLPILPGPKSKPARLFGDESHTGSTWRKSKVDFIASLRWNQAHECVGGFQAVFAVSFGEVRGSSVKWRYARQCHCTSEKPLTVIVKRITATCISQNGSRNDRSACEAFVLVPSASLRQREGREWQSRASM